MILKIAWVVYNLVFVVPFLLYSLVNFYGWFFAGWTVDVDRMVAGVFALVVASAISALWLVEGWLSK